MNKEGIIIPNIHKILEGIMKSYFIIFLICLFVPYYLMSSIINVPTDQPSIQSGIDVSLNGDTVLVADGLYIENIKFKGKAITVASHYLMDSIESHISNTIIDGSSPTNPDSGTVVYFISGEDTNSVLYGFTITGGTGTYDASWHAQIGGGILLTTGAKIIHNYIRNNTAIGTLSNMLASSGGIDAYDINSNGILIIENNVIQYNQVEGDLNITGGGMSIFNYDSIKVINNVISNNIATSNTSSAEGGGFYCSGLQNSNFSITNNKICNNIVIGLQTQEGYGGGIELREFNIVTIANNIVCNNQANYGGGIDIYSDPVDKNKIELKRLNNTRSIPFSVSKTSKSLFQPNIINNTFYANNASVNGGAIRIESHNPLMSDPEVQNCIFWNDIAPTGSEIYIFIGGINITYSDINGGWAGTGNIDSDPLFADTLFHLGPGSPCIDAGHPSPTCNDSDGTRNDMGVYGGLTDSLLYHITGLFVNDESVELPIEVVLSQNYPNPFNPATKIQFSIPKTEFVTLKIFNLLGQEVSTLVTEKLTPGEYKYSWDASQLASGMYFYKLETESFSITKKMILLR